MTRMQADKAVVNGEPLLKTKGKSRVSRRPGLRCVYRGVSQWVSCVEVRGGRRQCEVFMAGASCLVSCRGAHDRGWVGGD